MKITIIGPGAIGTLLAAQLARQKNEVWLLDKKTERAHLLRKNGIRVEGLTKINASINASVEAKEIGRTNLVILCVKSYDTEEAIKKAADLVKEDTCVLTLQNGIGNIQTLNDVVGEDRVIAGVTSQAATLLGPGLIRHTGRGETIIGRVNKEPLGKARIVLGLLNQAGISTRSSRDINSLIWSKLIINAGINALSGITRLRNGMLLEYSETRELMRLAVSEAVRVAKRKRIRLKYDDPIQKVESVCKATSANLSSMLQDVLNKKQTEIDFINGAIVRQAKSLSIATPVNEVLTNLIKTTEKSYRFWQV
ncbi:MAG: 2-dehydropantoate 2-reductase [Candidatus Omnitrophica bacterium]|nr:2-dehydropantoate 2-reductase [Candidatus Omnitrophota bacterium]